MTAAAATVVASARDVGHGDVGLWEFVGKTGFESLVVAASKDPNAKVTVLLVSRETGASVLAVKAPTTAAAERAVEAEAQVLAELRARDLVGTPAAPPPSPPTSMRPVGGSQSSRADRSRRSSRSTWTATFGRACATASATTRSCRRTSTGSP
jgi:hypothetical protein